MSEHEAAAAERKLSEAGPVPIGELRRRFRDPDRKYGPVDCWWWEAAHLSRAKLQFQLEDLEAKGVSGTWYYPRYVNDEPLRPDPAYWTDGWWDLTAFSAERHGKCGMVSWVSDWTAHEYFQNKLRAELPERPELGGLRLALYHGRPTGTGPICVEIPAEEQILHAAAYETKAERLDYASRIDLVAEVDGNRLTWLAPGEDWEVVIVTAQPHDLDYLNVAVADRWIDLFLGEYERRTPDRIGNVIQAYGPDEMFVLRGNILFSPVLIERFLAEEEATGSNPVGRTRIK